MQTLLSKHFLATSSTQVFLWVEEAHVSLIKQEHWRSVLAQKLLFKRLKVRAQQLVTGQMHQKAMPTA